MPESLGPAASQTLDPRAGTPNAQGLAHRTRAVLAQCMRGAGPRGWLVFSTPWFCRVQSLRSSLPAPSPRSSASSVSRPVRAASESSPCTCNTDARLLADANVFEGAAPSTRRGTSSAAQLIRAVAMRMQYGRKDAG